jgi:uncharacterized protein (UPF0262 family)
MGWLASLIPAGISLASSLFGGSKQEQVQAQSTTERGSSTPGYVLDLGSQMSDFVKKYLPNYTPGEAYSGPMSAEMTPLEQKGQSILGGYLDQAVDPSATAASKMLTSTLTGDYNPLSSPYYQAMKDEAIRNQEKAIDVLNRESAAGGDFFSSGRLRGVSDIATDTANKMATTMGTLYESERNRQISAAQAAPQVAKYLDDYALGKVSAASAYGSIPRLIKQAAYERNYNEFVRQQGQLENVAKIGSSAITGAQVPTATTTTTTGYAPSSMERIMGAVSDSGILNKIISGLGW